jgi:hypothetical protein
MLDWISSLPSRSAAVPDGGLAASTGTALTQWWLWAGRGLCMAGTLPALARGWSPNMDMLIPPNHGLDCHCYCSRCPEALLATYERRGQLAIARLALSPVSTSEPVGMKSPLLTESFSTAA